MSATNHPCVSYVESNFKRGVSLPLGRLTLLWGDGRTGKSTVGQALQLLGLGAVEALEGPARVKAVDDLARSFPSKAPEMYVRAEVFVPNDPEGVGRLSWSLKRTKGRGGAPGKLKKPEVRCPISLTFPYPDLEGAVSGDEKKAKAWFAEHVLGRTTWSSILDVLVGKPTRALVTKLRDEKALSPDWAQVSQACASAATQMRRQATEMHNTAQEAAPLPEGFSLLTEEERTTLQDEIKRLLQEINHGSAKSQAVLDGKQAQLVALDTRYRELAAVKARTEQAQLELQAQYDAGAAELNAELSAALSKRLPQAEMDQLAALHAMHESHAKLFGEHCVLCGSQRSLKEPKQRVQALVDQHSGVAALDRKVQQFQAQATVLMTQHTRTLQQVSQEMANLEAKAGVLHQEIKSFEVVSIDQLVVRRDELNAKLAQDATNRALKEQNEKAGTGVAAKVAALREDAALLESAGVTLEAQREKQVQGAIVTFETELNSFLPGDRVKLDLSCYKLGFLRTDEEGQPYVATALSGSEWVTLMMALAAWVLAKNPSSSATIPIFLPEDRGWDSANLTAVMKALAQRSFPGQIILTTTVPPLEPVEGWVVHHTPVEFAPRAEEALALEEPVV